MEPDQLAVLREVLHDHAPTGPPPPDRVESVLRRAGRRRRRTQVGAGVTVVLVVSGTLVGVEIATNEGSRKVLVPATSPIASQFAAPPTPTPSAPAAATTLRTSTTPTAEHTGDNTDLIGPRWTLTDAANAGSQASASAVPHSPLGPFLLLAADGSYSGADGCNGIAGTYRLTSGVLRLRGAITSYAACDGEYTSLFYRVTAGPMSVAVAATGDKMTLMAANQDLLVFRSQP